MPLCLCACVCVSVHVCVRVCVCVCVCASIHIWPFAKNGALVPGRGGDPSGRTTFGHRWAHKGAHKAWPRERAHKGRTRGAHRAALQWAHKGFPCRGVLKRVLGAQAGGTYTHGRWAHTARALCTQLAAERRAHNVWTAMGAQGARKGAQGPLGPPCRPGLFGERPCPSTYPARHAAWIR